MELLGKKWKYVNEGNVHIVLQLVGTEHVLRLIKGDKNSTNFSHMKAGVDFVNKVMNPLLKNYYYAEEQTVELPVDLLDELSRNLHNYRPQNRRFKSSISPHAIIASNLAVVSAKCDKNYCIEIKPKEGYLAKSLNKYFKCYFCLKQYTKLHLQQIPAVGGYCPLDLFSGNRARMKHALSNLVDNPQNNFKLFHDGSLVYHEKSTKEDFSKIITSTNVFDSMEIFFDFIIDVLVGDAQASDSPYDNKLKLQNKCDESNSLQKDSFLYNLLEVQKITETINVEDIKEINPDYVPTILEKIKNEKLNLYNENDRDTLFKVLEPTHAALISAVAKDCSIMISFSQDLDENFPFLQVNKHKIVYKLSVTDLEPKSLKSVLKRIETENKMIDIYHKYVGKGEIQPHTETREKQLEAWQGLIADYLKAAKQSTIDVRESQNSPLFNNVSINRKLSQEAIVTVLEHMAKSGRAFPLDKGKNVWEVYWHSLDEWGNMIYSWACDNGLNNSVCTLFELREGEDTADQEFHGLDMNILIKALKTLEVKGRCEVMDFDDNQGVKFF